MTQSMLHLFEGPREALDDLQWDDDNPLNDLCRCGSERFRHAVHWFDGWHAFEPLEDLGLDLP